MLHATGHEQNSENARRTEGNNAKTWRCAQKKNQQRVSCPSVVSGGFMFEVLCNSQVLRSGGIK